MPDQENPTYLNPQPGSSKTKTFLIIFLVILGIGLVVGSGILYFNKKTKEQSPETEAKPFEETSSIPSSVPTPTESAGKVNLSDYNVQILNGSGTPGEAGKVKALIEKEGLEDIETGNAKSYDYTTTEVQMVSDIPDSVYKTIEKALTTAGYSVKKGSTLDDDSDYDIIITVGSKKVGGASTSGSAVTPTPKLSPVTTPTTSPTPKSTGTPTPTKATTPTPTPTKTP